MILVFDIETDGLLDSVTKIHSLVIRDPITGKVWSCREGGYDSGHPNIREGLAILSNDGEEWHGHNIMGYDLPVIWKLYPEWRAFRDMRRVRDSLLCSRLMFTDLSEDDFTRVRKDSNFPARCIGSHSLEAWGYRLGILKGKFRETGDFKEWSPAMQEYCERDVEVTDRLRQHIEAQNYSPEAIELEHRFAEIIFQMTQHGVCFDRTAAEALYVKLAARREELKAELQRVFPPKRVEMKTPEYWFRFAPGPEPVEKFNTKAEALALGFREKDIKRGPNRVKEIPFNPASRDQIAERLTALGWKPEKKTETGKAQVDEAVLEGLPYPEAKPLAEYFMLQKRIGQIAEGENAWLKLERNGRIHGELITNGAVTGRCSHRNPNLAQVPRVKSPYGVECRSLFCASPGRVLVGADASGLELRCLAHYLSRYDGGEYIKAVTGPDIHTVNQQAFGLPEGEMYRGPAKNGIYCLIYGGGDHKLGTTLYPVALFGVKTDEEYEALGRKARRTFVENIRGFEELKESIAFIVGGPPIAWQVGRTNGRRYVIRDKTKARGWLKGLDGRRLRIRSEHAALNTLLQSAGALLVKKATVLWAQRAHPDHTLVWHVHDEVGVECPAEHAEAVGKSFVECVAEAGRLWGFRCPLTGAYKTGRTWAEVH